MKKVSFEKCLIIGCGWRYLGFCEKDSDGMCFCVTANHSYEALRESLIARYNLPRCKNVYEIEKEDIRDAGDYDIYAHCLIMHKMISPKCVEVPLNELLEMAVAIELQK